MMEKENFVDRLAKGLVEYGMQEISPDSGYRKFLHPATESFFWLSASGKVLVGERLKETRECSDRFIEILLYFAQ